MRILFKKDTYPFGKRYVSFFDDMRVPFRKPGGGGHTSTRFLRAINGGALSFSARPQLDYHGQRYTIQRYSCDPAAQTLTLTCRPKLQLRLSFTAHGADVQELSSDTHHDRA